MNVTIVMAPAVALLNRKEGSYGAGEVIALSCTVKPAYPGFASIPAA